MEFHERIIFARRQKGMTQESMAENIGVSRQAVSKWETGESEPDVDKLIALCQTLDLTLDYLCLGTDVSRPEDTQTQPPAPDTKQKSIPLYWRILSVVLVFALGLFLSYFACRQQHIEVPSLEQVSIAGTWLELAEDESNTLQCRVMLNDAWQTVKMQIIIGDQLDHTLLTNDGILHTDGAYYTTIDSSNLNGKVTTLYIRLYTEQEEQILELEKRHIPRTLVKSVSMPTISLPQGIPEA